jgi:hypothetical protein
MGVAADLEGLLGWLVLAIPLAVLATLAVLVRRRSRRASPVPQPAPTATGRYGAPVDEPQPPARQVSAPAPAPAPATAPPPPQPVSPPEVAKPAPVPAPRPAPAAPPPRAEPAVPPREPPPAGAPAKAEPAPRVAAAPPPVAAPPPPRREPPAPPPAPPAPPPEPDTPPAHARELELRAALSRAQSRGDEGAKTALLNELAGELIASGHTVEASNLLRDAIRISMRLGQREQHARARLELGDLAQRAGDLTTACEHWQLARGLFFDLGRARDLESCEERMQRHGCPTDWVLNDF